MPTLISAEYHLVSMIRHRVRLKTTKTLRVIRVTRVLVTLTRMNKKTRPRVGQDSFGVTRCGLEGIFTLVPTRFLLNTTT